VLLLSGKCARGLEVREVGGRDRNSPHVAGGEILHARGPITIVAFPEFPRPGLVEVTYNGQLAPMVIGVREGVILVPGTEANNTDSNLPVHLNPSKSGPRRV
jgi:hypothetical protein